MRLGPVRSFMLAVLLLAGTVLVGRTAANLGASVGPGASALLFLTPALLAVCLLVPVQTLPAIAFGLFALLPQPMLPSEGLFNVVRPATFVLGIWVVRRMVSAPSLPASHPHAARLRFGGRLSVWVLALLLVSWLAVSTWQSVAPDTSTAWISSFTTGALLTLLVFDARAEVRILRSTALVVGGAIAAYTVVEQLLRSSPVYGTIASIFGLSSQAPWSVYRSDAGFGHPLFAGAFLVVPAALGIGGWLGGGRTRELLLGGLCAAGAVMTVSRSAILAVVVGCATAVASALLSRRAARRRVIAVLALGSVAALATSAFGPLSERASSTESTLSAGVRTEAITVALRAVSGAEWFGTGPATSGLTGRMFSTIIIENSMLQLLISVGLPGLLLFVLLFVAAAIEAQRRRDVAAVAAIAAYLAAITGFNSVDAVREMHVLLGFLLLLALHGGVDTLAGGHEAYRPPTSRRLPVRWSTDHGRSGAPASAIPWPGPISLSGDARLFDEHPMQVAAARPASALLVAEQDPPPPTASGPTGTTRSTDGTGIQAARHRRPAAPPLLLPR